MKYTMLASQSKIEVIEALTRRERRAVYQLRYRTYVEEMKRFLWYADHRKKQVCEPLDKSGHIFLASDRHRDHVIGTARVNVGADEHFGTYTQLYRLAEFAPFFPKAISITTRLMVTPSYRRSRVALELASACYMKGLELGTCFDFIDCRPHLVRFFKHLGYRQVFDLIARHPEFGDEAVPLVLVLHDVDHMQKVGSPFSRIGRRFEDRLNSLEFFRDRELRTNPSSSPSVSSEQ